MTAAAFWMRRSGDVLGEACEVCGCSPEWDAHIAALDAFLEQRMPGCDWDGGDAGIVVVLSGDWVDGTVLEVLEGTWMVSLEVGQLVAMSEVEYDAAGRPGDPAASPPNAPAARPPLP